MHAVGRVEILLRATWETWRRPTM